MCSLAVEAAGEPVVRVDAVQRAKDRTGAKQRQRDAAGDLDDAVNTLHGDAERNSWWMRFCFTGAVTRRP